MSTRMQGHLTLSHCFTPMLVLGDRGMRDFLQKHGVIGVTAQKLLEEFGSLTEERVRQDPYTALTKTSQGSTYRCALLFEGLGFMV